MLDRVARWRLLKRGAILAIGVAAIGAGVMPALAQDPLPPPSSTGTNIPLTYQRNIRAR